MHLLTYFKQTRGAQAVLAKATGIQASLLSAWANGDRNVPVASAVLIEKGTGLVVRRWDLRPQDWHLIWPELVGVDGAPMVKPIDAPCNPNAG